MFRKRHSGVNLKEMGTAILGLIPRSNQFLEPAF